MALDRVSSHARVNQHALDAVANKSGAGQANKPAETGITLALGKASNEHAQNALQNALNIQA